MQDQVNSILLCHNVNCDLIFLKAKRLLYGSMMNHPVSGNVQ